jgi:hypothetical protein
MPFILVLKIFSQSKNSWRIVNFKKLKFFYFSSLWSKSNHLPVTGVWCDTCTKRLTVKYAYVQ